MPAPFVPKINGPWRLLYRPEKTGCYVNDHSLIRALDGSWHLFGITRDSGEIMPDRERWFTHGRGSSLHAPGGLEEAGIACDNGVRAWAPAVVCDGGRYYIFYGPSPLRFATSDELTHWMEHPVAVAGPLDACHRDPFVLRQPDGSWLMYASGTVDRCGAISVYGSKDLQHWRFLNYALRTTPAAGLNPPWGAAESPCVVARGPDYYLFVNYTDSRAENYHDALVFHSTDPLNFGTYTGRDREDGVVARLHAHAPEVVEDEEVRPVVHHHLRLARAGRPH